MYMYMSLKELKAHESSIRIAYVQNIGDVSIYAIDAVQFHPKPESLPFIYETYTIYGTYLYEKESGKKDF